MTNSKSSTDNQSAKPYHHGQLKETLIDAGIQILEEEDIRALSLRKVAKRAEVSHAAPYRHFEDKVALLAAIAERGFVQLADCMEQQSLEQTDQRQILIDIGVAYVEFGIRHPAQLTLMFSDLIKLSGDQALTDAAQATFATLTRAVEMAQKAGVLKAGDPEQIGRTFWAMEHGLAMLMKEGFFEGQTQFDRRKMIVASIEHLMAGMEAS